MHGISQEKKEHKNPFIDNKNQRTEKRQPQKATV